MSGYLLSHQFTASIQSISIVSEIEYLTCAPSLRRLDLVVSLSARVSSARHSFPPVPGSLRLIILISQHLSMYTMGQLSEITRW